MLAAEANEIKFASANSILQCFPRQQYVEITKIRGDPFMEKIDGLPVAVVENKSFPNLFGIAEMVDIINLTKLTH